VFHNSTKGGSPEGAKHVAIRVRESGGRDWPRPGRLLRAAPAMARDYLDAGRSPAGMASPLGMTSLPLP
jgi:hypothetical protein